MTRRIAIAILMIVWLSLLTAGLSTYFIARTLLLADLDETILGRVASLPEVERPGSFRHEGDFVIQNFGGHNIASSITSTPSAADVPTLKVLNASFSKLADGSGIRTLRIQAYHHRENPDDKLEPITVVYRASTEQVDGLLRNLIYSLSGFGLLAVAGTSIVANSVAKVALKPIRDAAEVIGMIDETSLDRRIAVEKLPPELAPVGKRLNDMLARLETAFVQRKQFLADASHELRTPVAGLVTTLEVALRRRREPEEYLRTLETCLSDARLLNRLIVALLEQVRSQRFSSQLELLPVPVTPLLRQCAELAATLGGVKNITVSQGIPEEFILLTDEQKLRSIVTNLLSNAVEYTPAGGHVRVEAELNAIAMENGSPKIPPAFSEALKQVDAVATTARRLVIRITDDGPGIAPEHLLNLFEPFYRADSARTNPEHHLGLGLSIVRAYCRAMGGDCRVKSPPSPGITGCEFTVELPTVEVRARGTEENRGGARQSSAFIKPMKRETV